MAAAARHGDIITDVTELSVSVETREPGSPIVVRLAGEADVTTRALAEVLAAETAKEPQLRLVDVSELASIDSAALQEFSRANRRLRARGGQLALVGPAGAVARIIELTALDQVFPIYATAEAAGRSPWPTALADRTEGERSALSALTAASGITGPACPLDLLQDRLRPRTIRPCPTPPR